VEFGVAGMLTNDALAALRAYCERPAQASKRREAGASGASAGGFRSRRTTPPTAQGRWALNAARSRRSAIGDGVESCDCAAVADAVWGGVSRDGACGESAGRIFGDL
jgi:hypothetical protein